MSNRNEQNYSREAICVPITGLIRPSIFATARDIADAPVDMAEWRLDYFTGSQDEILDIISDLQSSLNGKKLIVTLRTTAEGGEDNGDRFDYFEIIEKIIEQGVADYVDVELEKDSVKLRALTQKYSDREVGIIGSYHDFEKMPSHDFIIDKLSTAKRLGCDLGKLACMARSYEDAITLLGATGEFYRENPEYPIATMAMGREGYVTRLYGGLYGSRITFATLGKASAPGQRSVKEVHETFEKLYSDPEHIILIGFMGTGKTTISKKISEKYDMPEIDTDSLIVEKYDKQISQIFEEEGEESFRRKETDILDELGTWNKAVVSCGGGTVLRDINIRKLREFGTIVLLSASPQTILDRVRDDDSRPLLQGHKNTNDIEEMMKKRLPAYEAAADIVIQTDGKSPEEVADEVIRSVGDS